MFLALGDVDLIKRLTKQDFQIILSNPQNLNSYSYVTNNPILNADPDGNYLETAFDLAMFSWSLRDYKENPSYWNGFSVFADAISIVTPIPAIVGGIKHGDNTYKVVKNVNRARTSSENIIRFALEYGKNINFTMSARGWSVGVFDDSLGNLVEHFIKHGNEFGARSVNEYYRKANKFLDDGRGIIMQSENGFEIWDKTTNTLAITDKSGGNIRSFYKVTDDIKINNLNEKIKNL